MSKKERSSSSETDARLKPQPSRKSWRLPKQLRFRVHDQQLRAEASTNLGEFVLGPEIIDLLRILDGSAVRSPTHVHGEWVRSMKEACEAIPPAADLPGLIAELQAAGVLLGAGKTPGTSTELGWDRFADPWIQWAMLADRKRLEAYETAITELIRPGDAVLDLGAGSGVLSFFATRAGAGRVLALEESGAADLARQLLRRASSLLPAQAARPEVLRSNSSDALAELVRFAPDLLVSELFGHDPLSEGVLATLREVQSALGPKLRSIPESVSLFGQFVTVEPQLPLSQRLHDWHEARLSAHAGSRKTTSPADAGTIFQELFCALESWDSLSFSYPLGQTDFRPHGKAIILLQIPLAPVPAPRAIRKPVRLSAQLPKLTPTTVFLLWFESRLSPKAHLSSHPGSEAHCNHWNPIVIPLWSQDSDHRGPAVLHVDVSESLLHVNVRIESGGTLLGARQA